jgi:hypothetical protein
MTFSLHYSNCMQSIICATGGSTLITFDVPGMLWYSSKSISYGGDNSIVFPKKFKKQFL